MTTTYFSFDLAENAQSFLGAAMDHGAKAEDISVVAEPGVLDDKEKVKSGLELHQKAEKGITTTTPADVGVGAAAGAGIGLTAGILAGLASIFVPGIGLVIGGGALATAIAGAAATTAGGAMAGGITGHLLDLGVDGDVTEDFENDYKGGKVIVGVTYREGGIAPADLQLLAKKYHASRTTFEGEAEALPPIHIGEYDGNVVDRRTDGHAAVSMGGPEPLPDARTIGQEAQDIMTAQPVCCHLETSLRDVARMMVEHDCGAIPVLDDLPNGRPIGIVTDRDIVCRTLAEDRDPLLLQARDCMTKSLACVKDSDSLNEVCRVMEEMQVRRVPVLRADGTVAGIIAQADLARKSPERISAEVVREISKPAASVY